MTSPSRGPIFLAMHELVKEERNKLKALVAGVSLI